MKTACFTGVRKVEIVDATRPRLERPEDVLLRIERVGVCGSDVHYYLDGRIGDQVVQFPATLGHECAGTVVEVGAAVASLRPGDRVAVDPAVSCGRCDQCRAGRVNTCRKLRFMGSPGELPGAAAECYVLPAANCFPIPATMSLDEAVLVEPLSIALYAAQMAGLHAEAKIAVLGAGPIGLGVLLCCKAVAPCTAYVTDLLDERLQVARSLGADWTGNARLEDARAAIAQREPQGLDFVFECAGDPACVDQGLELLAPGGTLLMVGISPGDRLSLDPHRMRRAELTIKAVRRQRHCVAAAIELLAQQRNAALPLVTHHFPLDQIGAAFELVAGYQDGVIKAVVDLDERP
jgi:L-iditol 2-dehydrogenase